MGKIKKIIKCLLILLLGFFLLLAFFFLKNYSNFQEYYQETNSGKINLEQSVFLLKNKEYIQAQQKAMQAEEDFNQSLDVLGRIEAAKLFNTFFPLNSSFEDLSYFTKTTIILSKSIVRSSEVLISLDRAVNGSFDGSISDLSINDRQNILDIIYKSTPELNGLKANLQLSINNLDKIHKIGIFLPLNKQLSDLRSQLLSTKNILDEVVPLTELIPVLSGYPKESEFLIILQNNDELRPSGGFIGTYGVMKVKDGKADEIVTEDIYHLDMPCIGKLKEVAPDPVVKYMGVKNLWLRDANWSPDFPTTAKKVSEMFVKESVCANKKELIPDAVIAINPDLIADLISLVGPITVKGTTYNKGNFQPLLQYNVEISYVDDKISSWDRKEIINDLVSELEKILLNLPSAKIPDILNILKNNIAKRNLQIYFSDNNWQEIAVNLGVTGEIKQTNQDYLMVVDANLAAFKSDSVMKKNISYSVSDKDGAVIASLQLDYKHEGDFDWRTTRYRSYIRIYAPLGSKLLNSTKLEDFSTYNDKDLNKTVFAFFWSIEPGEEENIYLNYQLPNNIDYEHYSLYFQKQSGSRINSLKIINNLSGKEKILWQESIDRDYFFR